MKKVASLIFLLIIGIHFSFSQDLQWAHSITTGDNTTSQGVVLSTKTDVQGNLYSVGFFEITTDFDPGPGVVNSTTNGLWDIYVHKVDANGDFLWVKTFGDINFDSATAIDIDASGNIYITGRFFGTIDFDPGNGVFNLTSSSIRSVFVLKLDSNGDFVTAKAFGGTGDLRSENLKIDGDGNMIISGWFLETIDFDPNSGTQNQTSNGSSDFFILKLDSDGNFIWVKTGGSASLEIASHIEFDTNNNIYITGEFSDIVDFNPGGGTQNLTSNGSTDIFILKLNANGSYLWAKSFGGLNGDAPRAIEIDAFGNVFTTGNFEGTIDFDPSGGINNLTSVGSDDIFIQKLDTNGNYLFAKRIGGANFDEPFDLEIDSDGSLYCVGAFGDTVDFDPNGGVFNVTAEASVNGFILKLDTDANFISAFSVGGTADNGITNLNIIPGGVIYTSGVFFGSGDFDPGSGVTILTAIEAEGDLFFQKFSSTLNIEDFANTLQTTVYPNPTSSKFTVDLGKTHTYITTEITNTLGQLIKKEKFENTNSVKLEINNGAGIYFVNITTVNGISETIKIIRK